MMHFAPFDERPVVVAIAGPNGAGKTTFYYAHLKWTALPFINADVLARELDVEPYAAAGMASAMRCKFVERRESFIFETVFSDPVGDNLAFLREAVDFGYTVVLCFIGIADREMSECRVAMRVSQGGHDVPDAKLRSRFPRSVANLKAAIHQLPHVLIFDNSDLSRPFRQVAVFEQGSLVTLNEPVPDWLQPLP